MSKLTSEELQKRKVEFLKGLRNLLSEYNVAIDYNSYGDSENPFCYTIVTDGHLDESWENVTILKELDEDCIDEYNNNLNLSAALNNLKSGQF